MNDQLGLYVIRCVAPAGVTLAQYGGYRLEENEAVDLLDQELPDEIRFSQFAAADVACTDLGFELAQRIDAGELEVVARVEPTGSGGRA